MYALILAGGKASRLGMGEKALVRIRNRPLISYVLDSVTDAGLDPFVIVTSQTPYTTNYCRIHDIAWMCTDGSGYVEDIRQAVLELSIREPFFTICTDLPGITSSHLITVLSEYQKSGYPACSVWTPFSIDLLNDMITKIETSGLAIPGTPVGLNILRGDHIDEVQKEIQIILNDPVLALNINTREDLVFAEKCLPSDILKA